jgi:hypothetical protein
VFWSPFSCGPRGLVFPRAFGAPFLAGLCGPCCLPAFGSPLFFGFPRAFGAPPFFGLGPPLPAFVAPFCLRAFGAPVRGPAPPLFSGPFPPFSSLWFRACPVFATPVDPASSAREPLEPPPSSARAPAHSTAGAVHANTGALKGPAAVLGRPKTRAPRGATRRRRGCDHGRAAPRRLRRRCHRASRWPGRGPGPRPRGSGYGRAARRRLRSRPSRRPSAGPAADPVRVPPRAPLGAPRRRSSRDHGRAARVPLGRVRLSPCEAPARTPLRIPVWRNMTTSAYPSDISPHRNVPEPFRATSVAPWALPRPPRGSTRAPVKALAADLERARAAATTVAPRGATPVTPPFGPREGSGCGFFSRSAAAPRGSAGGLRVPQRPSTAATSGRRSGAFRAPPGGRCAATGPQLFENILPPFGNLRGGAGARTTRAPGRPRWGKTRSGPRRAPGVGAPCGAHISTRTNYTFSQNQARSGPEMFHFQRGTMA